MTEELHHRDRCAIVGIGETDYSRNSGRSDLTLATQAALAAITVLVFRELNGRSGQRYGMSSATVPAVGGGGTYDELYMPCGLLTPGQAFAMFAQRHMIEFGTTPEQLGQIPITCRKRANANPPCTDARSADDD